VSAVAVAIVLLILAASVVWGCVVDWLRHVDDRHNRDEDDADHHRALMRELRRHTSDDGVRWRR
jgi:hypothetical protein